MNYTVLIACTSKFAAIHWAKTLQNAQYDTYTCPTNLTDALTIIDRQSTNVLLTEATFANNRGFELARQAMMVSPALRCVVLMPPGPLFWQQAIQTDVSGYLADPLEDEAELLHCLSEIGQRRRYISPALQHLALIPSPDVLAIVRKLSIRYKQVLKLVARGLSARQIGIELKISEGTARTHKAKLVPILGLKSAAELRGFGGSVLGWLD